MADIHSERILILDFGAQYTQLIARRVRELGVYCEILSCGLPEEAVEEFQPSGIILSGGPESVVERDSPRAPQSVFSFGVPVLGICYGMQTMAVQLGGRVEPVSHKEFGHADIQVVANSSILPQPVGAQSQVWMSHGDQVTALPPGFVTVAQTATAPVAAMVDEQRRYYAVQFHPEVTHTRDGEAILRRFVRDICGCRGLWTASAIIADAITRIRDQVGRDEVILGLSGGVDSSVVAALLQRAIGTQLTAIFVDNGLLRLNEGDDVMSAFAKQATNALPIHIVRVDAQKEFMQHLRGVDDPEAKRKAIGRTFVDVFEREAARFENAQWLAQGTIYPDVIESAASKHGKAHVIKSHHNVGGLPAHMRLKLLEPLRELFKDEVRKIGLELGLPESLVFRHPFPGPGLGVRILGEVRKEYADALRLADHIFIEELRAADWYDKVSQAFAVYLPVKSVGVVGDARRFEHVIALRAVQTSDFMTADWAPLPTELLGRVSRRIVNEIPTVSRVVYDISSKPPATIEWE